MAVYLAFDRFISRVANPTPKCTLGLALVAKGSRPPVYDALTVGLCFSNAREFDAQRAQAALESLGDLDRPGLDAVVPALAPSGKLRVVVITDVGLRPPESDALSLGDTVDTDDWVMLALLIDIVKLGNLSLDHVTILLSCRKKGADGKKDRTTPEDVSTMLELRVGMVRRLDATTFVLGATTVRVFQQRQQTTVRATRLLTASELLGVTDDHELRRDYETAMGELRAANADMLAYLRAVHCAEDQDTVVLGCGPIDVLTAETLRACIGWTVSFADATGVNSGSVFVDAQFSYRGALAFSSFGRTFDIGTRVSRGTSTTDYILDRVCDAQMLAAVAENAEKVAGTPLLISPVAPSTRTGEPSILAWQQQAVLAWRILCSNVETLLPHFWDAFGEARALETVSVSAVGAALARVAPVHAHDGIGMYASTFGLSFVANTLLAFGKPLDVEAALSALSTGLYVTPIVEYGDLPEPVRAAVDSVMPRANALTAHDLFAVGALSIAARLWYVLSTAREFGVSEVSVLATPPAIEAGGLRVKHPLAYSTVSVSHREFAEPPLLARCSSACVG